MFKKRSKIVTRLANFEEKKKLHLQNTSPFLQTFICMKPLMPYSLKIFYHLYISFYVFFFLNFIFTVDNIHKNSKECYFFQVKESATVTVPFDVFYAEKQTFVSYYHGHIRALNWWTIAQSLKPCGKRTCCCFTASLLFTLI